MLREVDTNQSPGRGLIKSAVRRKFAVLLLIAALYICAVGFTNAHFMADSGGYLVSILAFQGVSEYVIENPVVRDYRTENPFWDFGHLLWRPIGLLLFRVFNPISRLVIGPEPNLNVLLLLMSVNFAAGLLSVLLLYKLLDNLTGRTWLSVFVTVAFIFSHGFLNFTQTGSSYIAGLSLVIVGLYLLLRSKDASTHWRAIGAGLAFSMAVTMWTLYVLVIPAAIVAPVVLFGWDDRSKLIVVQTTVTFLLATAIAYGTVMAVIGVNSPTDVRDWIAASSHGVHTSGVSRMLFGFPRSFIHMGNDGVLFKRFLLKDPFNPVSAADLLRLSLWKLGLFYLAAGCVLASLYFSSTRRILILLLLNAGPVIIFAILFDGGAVERYLPLYPLLFVSVAFSLAATRLPRPLRLFPIIFFSIATLTNFSTLARISLDRQQLGAAERIEGLLPGLKPGSWLVTTHLQDDLVNFQSSFPFHPINRSYKYHLYPLVVPNSNQVPTWREEFASTMLDAWARGGDVWLSRRLLSETPQARWNWVEGDDPNISWNQIASFFSELQTGIVTGGADGFVLLEKSDANAQFLKAVINKSRTSNLVT